MIRTISVVHRQDTSAISTAQRLYGKPRWNRQVVSNFGSIPQELPSFGVWTDLHADAPGSWVNGAHHLDTTYGINGLLVMPLRKLRNVVTWSHVGSWTMKRLEQTATKYIMQVISNLDTKHPVVGLEHQDRAVDDPYAGVPNQPVI